MTVPVLAMNAVDFFAGRRIGWRVTAAAASVIFFEDPFTLHDHFVAPGQISGSCNDYGAGRQRRPRRLSSGAGAAVELHRRARHATDWRAREQLQHLFVQRVAIPIGNDSTCCCP